MIFSTESGTGGLFCCENAGYLTGDRIRIFVSPGTFGEETEVTETDGQGLPFPLPAGWSPVCAVHVGPDMLQEQARHYGDNSPPASRCEASDLRRQCLILFNQIIGIFHSPVYTFIFISTAKTQRGLST